MSDFWDSMATFLRVPVGAVVGVLVTVGVGALAGGVAVQNPTMSVVMLTMCGVAELVFIIYLVRGFMLNKDDHEWVAFRAGILLGQALCAVAVLLIIASCRGGLGVG